MDDDLLAEVSRLGQEAGVEGDTAGGGEAASRLVGHGADVGICLGSTLIRLAQAWTWERRISLGIISSRGCEPARFGLLGDHDDDLPEHPHEAWATSTTASTPELIRARRGRGGRWLRIDEAGPFFHGLRRSACYFYSYF